MHACTYWSRVKHVYHVYRSLIHVSTFSKRRRKCVVHTPFYRWRNSKDFHPTFEQTSRKFIIAPVNMQVSYRYRHLPGLYRTCRIPFANTGLVLFQYLHADTYNLQANVFRPGTFWIPAHQYIHTLPVNIFWPDTVLPMAYWYLLLTGKYLLARYHFALNIPIPTLYRQISSGPVPFCP